MRAAGTSGVTGALRAVAEARARRRARDLWAKVRRAVFLSSTIGYWKQIPREGAAAPSERTATTSEQGIRVLSRLLSVPGPAVETPRADERHVVMNARRVALALFLGLLVDGVPEGILMGFLAAEGHLTPVLVVSILVANFPEAFSSASLLVVGEMSTAKIIGMWSTLCVLVGCLSGASCFLLLYAYPEYGQPNAHKLPLPVLMGISLVEGATGGAMIACIAAVMLPEAFERAGKGNLLMSSGFLCAAGFLAAMCMKAVGG